VFFLFLGDNMLTAEQIKKGTFDLTYLGQLNQELTLDETIATTNLTAMSIESELDNDVSGHESSIEIVVSDNWYTGFSKIVESVESYYSNHRVDIRKSPTFQKTNNYSVKTREIVDRCCPTSNLGVLEEARDLARYNAFISQTDIVIASAFNPKIGPSAEENASVDMPQWLRDSVSLREKFEQHYDNCGFSLSKTLSKNHQRLSENRERKLDVYTISLKNNT